MITYWLSFEYESKFMSLMLVLVCVALGGRKVSDSPLFTTTPLMLAFFHISTLLLLVFFLSHSLAYSLNELINYHVGKNEVKTKKSFHLIRWCPDLKNGKMRVNEDDQHCHKNQSTNIYLTRISIRTFFCLFTSCHITRHEMGLTWKVTISALVNLQLFRGCFGWFFLTIINFIEIEITTCDTIKSSQGL